MALIGLLRMEGPLTATQAAGMLGESSGSCSFHLRQLARYGLVEEAGGGQGREKPWRATAMFTQWSGDSEDPGAAEAAGMLSSYVAERYFENLRLWLQAMPGEPQEWRDAAQLGDTMLYLTAAELAELDQQTRALTERFLDRLGHPELRPPGARPVTYLHLAFPMQRIMGHPLPAPPPSHAEQSPPLPKTTPAPPSTSAPTTASPSPTSLSTSTTPTSAASPTPPASTTSPTDPGGSK
jgi:hypothetical protein